MNKQTTKKVTPQSKIAAAKRSLSTTKQTNTKRRKLIRSSCSLDFNSDESLHLGVMAFLTNTSDSIISRIFSAWSIFLSTLFDSIDLSPYPGEVISLLPKEFWSSGFQDTVLLGDCTENWISSPENYDVSSATFSWKEEDLL